MTTPAERFAEKHNAALSPPAAGHNSKVSGVPDSLESYVKRCVALEEEKATLATDIRELKAEAKEQGIDPKALAAMAKLQMEDAEKRTKRLAHEQVVDSYKLSLGFLD